MTEDSAATGIKMNIMEIMKKLPHRYPFLLVDKILEMNFDEDYVIGQKNLTMNEAFFQGHFPHNPLMPGVLIVEALAQVGAVMVHSKDERDRLGVLLSVNNAKFRHPVRPGDILTLRCDLLHLSKGGGRVKGVATVDGKVAAQAEIGYAFVDQSQM